MGSSCHGNKHGTKKEGGRYVPSIPYKSTPAGSLSSSQPDGPPYWTSPLAFGLISVNQRKSKRGKGLNLHKVNFA